MDSTRTNSVRNVVVVLAALATAVAYAPMLTVFFKQLWSRPHSQFFPFVILAVVWLFWSRWSSAEIAARSNDWPFKAKAIAILAWVALLIAIAIYNPWLSAVSLILLTAAVAIVVARRRNVRYLWGIWALLLLLLPLPLGLDQQLISTLQLISSKWSSLLLDTFGVTHLMEGNTLLLQERKLFVDEACSGIVSVMSIVACGVIYGVWHNRPPLHVVMLAATGIVWAVVLNVLRITIIALMLDWYQIDWSEGTPHEILGLCLFVVAFGGMVSSDLMLLGLMIPIEERWNRKTGKAVSQGRLFVRAWDTLTELGAPLTAKASATPTYEPSRSEVPTGRRTAIPIFFSLGFGAVAIAQLGVLLLASASSIQSGSGVARAKSLVRESLPGSVAGLRCNSFRVEQRDRDDIFGEFSKIYEFGDETGRRYLVSCDFPFSQGWHELTICYSGTGWKIRDRQSTQLPEATSDSDWSAVEAVLVKPDGQTGFVTWAIFDERGEPISPPVGRIRDQIWRLFVRRSPLVPAPALFQVQVFTQGVGEISEEQKNISRKLLADARERIRQIIAPAEDSIQRVSWERNLD